jgi:hypothetical protein
MSHIWIRIHQSEVHVTDPQHWKKSYSLSLRVPVWGGRIGGYLLPDEELPGLPRLQLQAAEQDPGLRGQNCQPALPLEKSLGSASRIQNRVPYRNYKEQVKKIL